MKIKNDLVLNANLEDSSMKNRSSLLRMFKTISLVLTMGAGMTACGVANDKWKEEVQLSDGRTIVVERELIREGGGDDVLFASHSMYLSREFAPRRQLAT